MAKFSEIKGDKAMDVIAEIAEPVINIAEDDDAAELFGWKALPDDMTAEQYAKKRIKKALPALMGKHKEDIITICAALDGVSVEEYRENMTSQKVMVDLLGLMADPAFNAFFA